MRCCASVLVPALLFPLTTGCGGAESDPAAGASERAERGRDAPGSPRDAGAEKVEPQAVDPSTVGTITGACLFVGDPPRRREISTGAEPACRHDEPLYQEQVVVTDGKLRDVFVYLKRGQERWIAPGPPAEPVVLDQRGCIYTPHVSAVQVGQAFHVRNSDPLTHNVNVNAPRNDRTGNYTQGQGQGDLDFVFERREHLARFKCDIHPWMGAWVHVHDHPWFAVSAADGTFTIPRVPPGSYQLEGVHPELGRQRADVTLEPSGTARVELRFED